MRHAFFGKNKTLYDVLTLTNTDNNYVTLDKLASCRRRQLAKLHSDSKQQKEKTKEEDEDNLKEARELVEFAFEVLSDNRKKQKYDAFLIENPLVKGYSKMIITKIKQCIDTTDVDKTSTVHDLDKKKAEMDACREELLSMMKDTRLFF